MTTTYTVTIAPTTDTLTEAQEARLDRLATELAQWRDAQRAVNARRSDAGHPALPFSTALRQVMAAAFVNAERDLSAGWSE